MPTSSEQNSRIQIWILGLHRSGTTVFWESWRKDPRLLCFDEPLTDHLGISFPRNNAKRTFDEYLKIFIGDPRKFWGLYDPMYPVHELNAELASAQERYLQFLLEQSPYVVIDETHLHEHIGILKRLTPNGYVIHLHRRASAFVTSHLRPSWSLQTSWPRRFVRRFRNEINKRTFWTREDFVPGLHRDDVIGSHHESKFGLMLADAGYDAKAIMSGPTIVRLLAYWHFNFYRLERHGARSFGQRFTSLRYEDFASAPEATMLHLYHWVGLPPPSGVEYSDVHRPKSPFKEGDRRWRMAAEIAGFTPEDIESLL